MGVGWGGREFVGRPLSPTSARRACPPAPLPFPHSLPSLLSAHPALCEPRLPVCARHCVAVGGGRAPGTQGTSLYRLHPEPTAGHDQPDALT